MGEVEEPALSGVERDLRLPFFVPRKTSNPTPSTARTKTRAPLHGHHHAHLPGAIQTGPVSHDHPIEITLLLRRRKPLARTGRHLTRDDIERHHSVSASDAARIRAFANRHGLTFTPHIRHHATATLTGSASAVARAFHVHHEHFEHPH